MYYTHLTTTCRYNQKIRNLEFNIFFPGPFIYGRRLKFNRLFTKDFLLVLGFLIMVSIIRYDFLLHKYWLLQKYVKYIYLLKLWINIPVLNHSQSFHINNLKILVPSYKFFLRKSSTLQLHCIISVMPKGRSFTANSGSKTAILPKGRSSIANSGT